MVYVRGGAVVQEPGVIQNVLSWPMQLYHFILFFFMTLIDPAAEKKHRAASGGSVGRAPRPMGGVRRSGPGGDCPPMGG